jgi:hypothetical protein
MWLRVVASRRMGLSFCDGAAIASTETSPGNGNINDNVKKCLFLRAIFLLI